MADIKLNMPSESSGDLRSDFEDLKSRFAAVVKSLEYALSNLDEDNVTKSAAVNAENIDTSKTKITNAQIKNLSADKISAGELDTEKVTLTSNDARLLIQSSLITLADADGMVRLLMGLDTRRTVNGAANPHYNKFCFSISDAMGNSTIYFDDNGDAVFAETLDTLNDINVGRRIYINNAEGESGVYFLSRTGRQLASIFIDNDNGLYANASGGLFINGSQVATRQYVSDVLAELITPPESE